MRTLYIQHMHDYSTCQLYTVHYTSLHYTTMVMIIVVGYN